MNGLFAKVEKEIGYKINKIWVAFQESSGNLIVNNLKDGHSIIEVFLNKGRAEERKKDYEKQIEGGILLFEVPVFALEQFISQNDPERDIFDAVILDTGEEHSFAVALNDSGDERFSKFHEEPETILREKIPENKLVGGLFGTTTEIKES